MMIAFRTYRELSGQILRMLVLFGCDCIFLEAVAVFLQGTHLLSFWSLPGLVVFWGMNLLLGGYSLLFRVSDAPFNVLSHNLQTDVLSVAVLAVCTGIVRHHDMRHLYIHLAGFSVLILILPLFRRMVREMLGHLSWMTLPVCLTLPLPLLELWEDYLVYDRSSGIRSVKAGTEKTYFEFAVCPQDSEAFSGPVNKNVMQIMEDNPFVLVPGRKSRRVRSADTGVKKSPAGESVKRVLDIVCAITGLILFGPMMILIALMLKVKERGNVLYASRRIGLHGGAFVIWKFRTMHAADANPPIDDGAKLENEDCFYPRKKENDSRIVSSPGKWLRKTSLDELPQFWNVLRGDMSLVGPRPLVPDEGKCYGDNYPRLLSVRPGLTGLWQVSGRNHIPYVRRIRWDMYYIRHHSFFLDWDICLRTVREILTAHGM